MNVLQVEKTYSIKLKSIFSIAQKYYLIFIKKVMYSYIKALQLCIRTNITCTSSHIILSKVSFAPNSIDLVTRTCSFAVEQYSC
jgi:hypothetical protein